MGSHPRNALIFLQPIMFVPASGTEQTGRFHSWRYFPIGLAAVLVYLAMVYGTRWYENRAIDQAAREKAAAREVEEARRTVQALGGTRLEILGFYTSPGVIRRGASAELCYGVSNAQSVHIEPFSGEAWPSYGRCVSVSPRTDTTYTLTAKDAAGNTKTATTLLKVK
jgi:hypothetical protein